MDVYRKIILFRHPNPGGGGLNAAIFNVAGPPLEAATNNRVVSLLPRNTVVVPLPSTSHFYSWEGVTHLRPKRSSINILSAPSVPEDKISGTMTKTWAPWVQSLYNIAMQPEKYKDEMLEALDDIVAKRHLLVLARFQGLVCLADARKEHPQLLLTIFRSNKLKCNSQCKTETQSWKLQALHLRVISQDFDSQHLQNKKHWNSFNTAFFRDSLDVIEEASNHGKATLQDDSRLLSMELCCHRCRSAHPTIPRLKSHIRNCQAPFPDALQKNGRIVPVQSNYGFDP
ncbi:transcription factor bHLH140-like [Durio zibethinus]|uniref:Transcription factor bHLH140-like n=1 Tax=Durio zibethinus TaxID=66656 RepID=A0A6P6AM07_DURZI|nr:transcription factor bHLH140-like [Durio zibethinus]